MTNAASPSTIDATEQDIEETLGNARDSAERNITAYRCWVIFGLAVLRVWRVLEGEALFPLVISLVYLGYCVALWAWVRRHGTRPGFALATTVVDLLSAGVFFLQFPRFEHDVHAQLAGQTLFPTLLFAGLLPNFLRYSREVALWTGPVATAVF
ncbi:MAG TPA: hypothetical protein VK420_19140, partial [Longimicrobium sp.]|nr:hypothetical protein [Longimicrobium sp.]